MFVSNNILFLFIFVIIIIYTKTSNAFRTQESSFQSRNTDQQNGYLTQSQQSLPPKSVYDILASIDERIRLLEAYDNTYKLTRLDFSLEQLFQRMISIESKLSRIENTFDLKITKIDETIRDLQLKNDFKSDTISRKIEDFRDKIDVKCGQIDTKFELKIDQIINKLESIERYIHLNSEEVLEKLIKNEEKHEVFESHVKSHINNIENLVKHSLDAITNIKQTVTYDFESVDKLVNTLKDNKHQQNSMISKLNAIVNQMQNSSVMKEKQGMGCTEQRQRTLDINGIEETNGNNTNGKQNKESKEIINNNNNIYDNISSTLAQLQQLGVDEKLTQLDVHVDYFSRKIINTIQEIWRSSLSSESYLREALDMANKTRSFIRQEFRRLQEQIAPMIKTPNFSTLREPLEQKLHQLSTTVDDSFNAVMISQNSFISSCNRIQEEEEQLYDILDDMLLEIRNKSSLDVALIKEAIGGQTVLINDSMTQLLIAIKSIDAKIIDVIKQEMLSNANKYSTISSDNSECFLTKNQLISVCNKKENSNKSKSNANNEQIEEEKSEEKVDNNYEDLGPTE